VFAHGGTPLWVTGVKLENMRDVERKKSPKGVSAFQQLERQFPTAYVSGIGQDSRMAGN